MAERPQLFRRKTTRNHITTWNPLSDGESPRSSVANFGNDWTPRSSIIDFEDDRHDDARSVNSLQSQKEVPSDGHQLKHKMTDRPGLLRRITSKKNAIPMKNMTASGSRRSSTTDVERDSIDEARLVKSQEDVPPDGGYGWVVCACVFLINAHTWGVNSAWGIFLAHYLSKSTFPDATQLEFALIGGLSISQCLLVSPLAAASARRFGTKITLLIGTSLVSVSLLGASFATQIWHLFLSQGLCFGYGMGFLYLTATPILPQWFLRRRSLALGIASSGAGFGGLAYNLGGSAGIESMGPQWTYRILALCTLIVNLGCSLLLKDRNNAVKPQAWVFNWREYGHVEVLLVAAWGFLTELGYIVLLYSLPNYATSIGLTASQGSVVGAVLNLGLAFGRPTIGILSDALGRINMAATTTAFCGLLCLVVWIPAKTYAVLLLFAFLSGTVTGTFWGCVAPVTTEVVGLQRLPSAFAMICLVLVLPTTFAEPIALQITTTMGYLSSQVFVGCMFLAGSASAWSLRSWKIYEIECKAEREKDDGHFPIAHGFWLTPRRLFVFKRV